ncbi:MAG: aminotransferase class IV, partial [Ignavibacteriaceae bacterium]|nr:aminotransferase class IV [Ignavibacteriaceae bacterium]
TIEYFTKSQTCKLGLGSGIVWDSNPNLELDEVNLKSKFLLESNDYFELIETIRVNGKAISLLDKHLTRLKNASEYFLFEFDEKFIIANINNTLNKLNSDKSYKMRLLLSKWGRSEIKVEEIDTMQAKVKCLINSERINSSDKFQYFKTTNRKLYNKIVSTPQYSQYFDVIYFNEKNELCEGARTNIFIRKDEKYFTPEISCGILNGIMREKFIEEVSAIQTKLFLEDLLTADEVILTNSVRGIIKVDEIIFGE